MSVSVKSLSVSVNSLSLSGTLSLNRHPSHSLLFPRFVALSHWLSPCLTRSLSLTRSLLSLSLSRSLAHSLMHSLIVSLSCLSHSLSPHSHQHRKRRATRSTRAMLSITAAVGRHTVLSVSVPTALARAARGSSRYATPVGLECVMAWSWQTRGSIPQGS